MSKDNTGALHARIHAGSGSAGQGRPGIATAAATLGLPVQSISNWVKAEQELSASAAIRRTGQVGREAGSS